MYEFLFMSTKERSKKNCQHKKPYSKELERKETFFSLGKINQKIHKSVS